MLTTIDSNKFNHKNKIGKFKFNDINNLINNIKNNTISEADTKKKINELNEINKTEVKGERLFNSQKILLSLFDYSVKAIFNNSNNSINNNNSNNNNENESKNENENENDDESVNDGESENENESENDDDDITVKEINNNFKKIDETII